ncbi:hypothetical protein KC963_05110 [Candidatus Saccharibacteria bacterium]|nr:hypothetical protein [Candidatus Saccharibacteria bacterium]
MSYTKGPWHIVDDTRAVRGFDGSLVVDCYYPHFKNRSLEEINANTCLIAAAPDLVEALEQVKQVLDEHCGYTNMSIVGARDLINYVLTKAKGGSHEQP